MFNITYINFINSQMLPETKISNELGDIALPYSPSEVLLPPPPPPPDLRIISPDSSASASDLSAGSGAAGPLPSPPEDFRCRGGGGPGEELHSEDTPIPDHYELRIRQHTSDDWDRRCWAEDSKNQDTEHCRKIGEFNEDGVATDSVRVLAVLQDEGLPPCGELLERYNRLIAFYALDSRCRFCETSFAPLTSTLRTLVLSHARLRRLPASLFLLRRLEVLKLDRNRLEEFPVELSKLSNLRLLCIDHQRPRLEKMNFINYVCYIINLCATKYIYILSLLYNTC